MARPALILVPTSLEERHLLELGGFPSALGALERCGFGPVSAAARCAQRLAEDRPARVLLIGIAGSLEPQRTPVGSAGDFSAVRLEGVGAEAVGAEERADEPIHPPSRLGLPQWDGEEAPVFEELPLPGSGGTLLTVCAASGTPARAAQRRRSAPAATAEDMEAFGVALACHLQATPLVVVRGISNVAGQRDPRAWRVREALSAARRLALEWLERESWGHG